MSSADHLPIGIRLNNPGCLRRACSPDSRTVMVEGYAYFGSLHEGSENLMWCIHQFYFDHKLNTLNAFLARYAPATENDLTRYINLMADWMGIPRAASGYTDLGLWRIDEAAHFARGIIRVECGVPSNNLKSGAEWVSQSDLQLIAVSMPCWGALQKTGRGCAVQNL